MRFRLVPLVAVALVLALSGQMNAFGAGQSTDRNLSNNGVACANTQSANAQSGNSRASTCLPTITSLSVSKGPATGGTFVIIYGTNLSNTTSVTFGSSAASISTRSTTSLYVTTTSGTSGFKNVLVTTTGGSANLLNAFEYVAAPTISSLSVTSGPTTGGTAVTINGTNLGYASYVTIGGLSASIISNTSTSIVLTTPSSTAGAKDVTVTTIGGTATLNAGYTYVAPFSPLSVQFAVYVKPGGCGLADNPCTPLPNGVSFDLCESSAPTNCVTIDSAYVAPKNLTLSSSNSTIRVIYRDTNSESLGLKYFVYVYRPLDQALEYIPSPVGSDYFYNSGDSRDSTLTFSNSTSLVFGVYANFT